VKGTILFPRYFFVARDPGSLDPGWTGCDLAIEWADRLSEEEVPPPIDLIVPPTPMKADRRKVKESRADSLRREQAKRDEQERKARRARMVAYHQEWKEFRSNRLST
jgi:hypothetical protein